MKTDNYTACEQTANILNAMVESKKLFDSVSYACDQCFGESNTDDAMQAFSSKWLEMQSELEHLLLMSICGNMAHSNNKTI